MSFQNTPVGAGKKFLVSCGGTPMAGFDTMSQAKGYIAMQYDKGRTCPKREQTYAAQQTYSINGVAQPKPAAKAASVTVKTESKAAAKTSGKVK